MNSQINTEGKQLEAVRHYNGPCNVIASAGSGKTSVVVSRVKNLIDEYGVNPGSILVVTFSNKACGEIRHRLTDSIPAVAKRVNVETFHTLGKKIIEYSSMDKLNLLNDYGEKYNIVRNILRWNGDDTDSVTVSRYLTYISDAKNNLIAPVSSIKEGHVYYSYEKEKKRIGKIDFDDMLSMSVKILQDNKETKEHFQELCQFILADEMQDANAAQYKMLCLLGEKNKNVFFVSDPLQNIYQWRGSSNKFVLNFKNDWPDAKIINLNVNYRCDGNIVALANRFAKTIPESQDECYTESIPVRPACFTSGFIIYKTRDEEINGITSEILNLVNDGCDYGDIAVISRTNDYLKNFEEYFVTMKIPYTTVTGITIADREEVKIIMNYLRLVINDADDEAFEYVCSKPSRNLGNKFIEETRKISQSENTSMFVAMDKAALLHPVYPCGVNALKGTIKYLQHIKFRNVGELVCEMRETINLDSYVKKIDDGRSYEEKIDTMRELETMATKYSDIGAFIDFVDRISDGTSKDSSRVHLLTVHKSKGLEFDSVFIVGVAQGLFPHCRDEDINEERRLMYVAITRAKDRLFFSYAKKSGTKYMSKSEFIKDLFVGDDNDMIGNDRDENDLCFNENNEDVRSISCDEVNYAEFGEFAWCIYDNARVMFPDIRPATLTRIMLLATYMDYNNVLVNDNGACLKEDEIREILGIKSTMYYSMQKELESNNIAKFGKVSTINSELFRRGESNSGHVRISYSSGKMISRLYKDGTRALYNSVRPDSVNKLSYVFRIMPFVNKDYNIVCRNPLETIKKKIIPLTVGDLADILGYGRSNAARLQRMLVSPVFDTEYGQSRAVRYVSGDDVGLENHCLFINPLVYYGGNKHNEVSVLGKFR